MPRKLPKLHQMIDQETLAAKETYSEHIQTHTTRMNTQIIYQDDSQSLVLSHLEDKSRQKH